MFFVVDKTRLQRMISIVREDRTRKEQGVNAPFLRIKAVGDELTVESETGAATFPATVYEPGVLFIRTTHFRRLLGTFKGEKFLSFQVTEKGLSFGNVLMPFEGSDMVLYLNPEEAPPSWPPEVPEAEQIREARQPTLFDLLDNSVNEKGESNVSENAQEFVVCEERDEGEDVSRRLLDQLLADSRLYRDSESYMELLSFVVQLRNVAPFNAMLLQLQKPGITHVASAHDWLTRFKRRPKEEARPLLILWPFGPVATVYDVQDTVGKPLPEDAFHFPASGQITASRIDSFGKRLQKKNIDWICFDGGDAKAGSIQVVECGDGKKKATLYKMKVNRNHEPAMQFTTAAHELGHLFLGHLGADKHLSIPKRRSMSHAEVELEAESVAYLVCERNGVKSKSQSYLSNFVESDTKVEDIDLYQVMRAAGQVETILHLGSRTKFK